MKQIVVKKVGKTNKLIADEINIFDEPIAIDSLNPIELFEKVKNFKFQESNINKSIMNKFEGEEYNNITSEWESIYDNSNYNGDIEADEQSQEFWDSI